MVTKKLIKDIIEVVQRKTLYECNGEAAIDSRKSTIRKGYITARIDENSEYDDRLEKVFLDLELVPSDDDLLISKINQANKSFNFLVGYHRDEVVEDVKDLIQTYNRTHK